MIETLEDIEEFRKRRHHEWARNVNYWLTGTLRHVADEGEYIATRVQALSCKGAGTLPVVVDMGCGNAWLLETLCRKNIKVRYVGIDNSAEFIRFASVKYGQMDNVMFVRADVETKVELSERADVVVNAFNFFELCDLEQAMANVKRWLRPDGTLLMSTIDKTYLMLALSKDWAEFLENLRRYQELPGTKYGFQRIDMGTAISNSLYYPSILYSTQDYIDAARTHSMHLVRYVEHAFTATLMPKIYCHLEFCLTSKVALRDEGRRNAFT